VAGVVSVPALVSGVVADSVFVPPVQAGASNGAPASAGGLASERFSAAAADVAVERGSEAYRRAVLPEPDAVPDAPRRVIALTVAAFALLQCAGNLGVQALSLFVTSELGGSIGSAGLILGLCAGLEIPLMLGFGFLSTRVPLRRLILAGPLFSVAYAVTVASAAHTWQVAAAQVFNASAVALLQGLGVSYVQDLLPRHPGRASTLFTNAFPAGAVLAGPILGVAQHLGYRVAYLTGAALAVLALTLLVTARPPSPTRHAPAQLHPVPRTGSSSS
jgi:SET family sugar efflux transporter-like MFS transporter